MAEKPSFDKFEGNSFSSDADAFGDPPPAYSETAMTPVKETLASAPIHPHPPAGVHPPAPPQMSYAPAPQAAPIQVVVPPPAPTITTVVVGNAHLPPGTCTVCRRGKIEDTASCCTWFWCCLLLPFGIIPGIIAFCCCCRRPKCTHCGFSI